MVVTTLGFLFLFCVPRLASGANNSVELLPQWKVGEKLHYQMVKTRLRLQDNKVALNASTRNNLEIEVLQASAQGYILRWLYGKTKLFDSKQSTEPLIQQMINNHNELQSPIILKINSLGSIEEVQNWEQIKETSTLAVDTIIKQLQNLGLDKVMVTKMRAQIASTFATKEQIEKVYTREPQLLFLVLGRTYTLSQPIEYKDKLPNPWGGESFPCRGEFALKTLDRKLGRAVVTWKQTILPEEAKRIIEKTMNDWTVGLVRQAPIQSLPENLTIEDAAEFSVDVSSGWIHSFTYTRIIKINKLLQKDTITISRKLK